MHVSATINTGLNVHNVAVATEGVEKQVQLPAKENGNGLAVNGAELLLLALATCCCNDIFREAAKKGITIQSVQVQAACVFGAEGEPGTGFAYTVQVSSPHPAAEIALLIQHVDRIAEVHNTIRKGTSITLKQ